MLAVGDNGMAQLGLKTAISQRQNPQPIPLPELTVQIAAGPLHSVCLTEKNQVFTFGCNDEHALGRKDNEDEDDDDADQFGLVDMSSVMDVKQEKIIQVVAGDSHTLVLSDAGKVYGKPLPACPVESLHACFPRLGNVPFDHHGCLRSRAEGCDG